MRKLLCLAVLLGSFPFPLDAQPIDWPPYEELALRQLQAYLQIETTNPPGNELAAARFFQEWFTREGIPVEVYEFAPGRANLIARLRGDGSRRPLILLNHMDVVSSDPERWRVPPFSGAILDGYAYGRGALDMKGEGLLQAVVFVLLHRAKVPLKRDVLFVATADEEVAMQGAQPEPVGRLLGGVHADVLHLAVLDQVKAAFSEQVLGLSQQVAVILD